MHLPAVPKRVIVLTLIFIPVICLEIGLFYRLRQKNQPEPIAVEGENNRVQSLLPLPPSPSPKPIPSGKQSYHFSHGSKVTGPKLQTVIIDPLDPERGENQTVTAVIQHSSPVTSASLKLETDNQVAVYPLELIAGDAAAGTWITVLQTTDSHDYSYYFNFELQSTTDSFQGGLKIR